MMCDRNHKKSGIDKPLDPAWGRNTGWRSPLWMRAALLSSLCSPAALASMVHGWRIGGYISPTYIYSQSQGLSSVIFGKGTTPFGYYSANTAAGSLYFSANKTFKNGSNLELGFIPNVSPDAPYYIARGKVPLESGWSAIVGLIPTWNSYDSWSAADLPTITRSLTVAYTIPAYMIGAGVEKASGGAWFKALAGNLDTPLQSYSSNPALEMTIGTHISRSFQVWDYALYGKLHSPNGTGAIYHDDVDASYNIGPVTLGGDLFYEDWQRGAVNGNTAVDYGGEMMANYAYGKRTVLTVRYDLFNDAKNGGANDISTYQSGFAPISANVGPIREEVTLAAQYRVTKQVLTKVEYRYDWANAKTFGLYRNFQDASQNIAYGTTNHSSLVAVQMVYEF